MDGKVKTDTIEFERGNLTGFCLGKPGSGRGFHPWDDLRECPECGGSPWMVGKDGKDYSSGEPYTVICLNKNCNHKSISSSLYRECKADWNGTNGEANGMSYAEKIKPTDALIDSQETIIVDAEREYEMTKDKYKNIKTNNDYTIQYTESETLNNLTE